MDTLNRLAFCPPGTPFFDVVADDPASALDYPEVRADLPPGWQRDVGPDWVLVRRTDAVLPLQGWKIHASATLASGPEVISIAHEYLLERGWVFKYLRGPASVLRRNGKYADRSASGKVVTIYPVDEAALETCLTELGGLLAGQPGPYILSDLRWEAGPLYVRYGGFVNRTVRSDKGDVVHVIESPTGDLVPDTRGVGFRPPPWVVLPGFLRAAVTAREAGVLDEFPYQVTGALHFSNAGGIYRGTCTRTGEAVLLREARPHAAQDVAGQDAVQRLEREEWALRTLAGQAAIPRLVERRRGHEHEFLVREHVDGESLATVLRRNPLTAGAADPEAPSRADYTRWALAMLADVESGITEMHSSGVVFGDLHPGNIIMRTDGRVAFIDLETAAPAEGHVGQVVGTPGFLAPTGTTGPAVDRFGLGCLRLATFLPTAPLIGWHPSKVEDALTLISGAFALPGGVVDQIRADLAAGTPEPRPEPLLPGHVSVEESPWRVGPTCRDDVPGLASSLAEGILAAATPERDDRLFPGDPAPLSSPDAGLDLQHGAAGVLWALHSSGRPVPGWAVDWLVERTHDGRLARPGFLDGAAGVALVLDRLGRPDDARRALTPTLGALRADGSVTGDLSLASGRAGGALVAHHLGVRWSDAELVALAEDVARDLADRDLGRGGAGLLLGPSGSALLWLALADRTGDPAWLMRAGHGLASDVSALTDLCLAGPGTGGSGAARGRPDATSRTLLLTTPGFGGGTAALAVALRTAGGVPDPAVDDFVAAVVARSSDALLTSPGLLRGHAGLLAVGAHLSGAVSPERLGELALFTLGWGGEVAVVGEDCLRLSTDLATGAAGVLTLLSWLEGTTTEILPLLPFASPTGAVTIR